MLRSHLSFKKPFYIKGVPCLWESEHSAPVPTVRLVSRYGKSAATSLFGSVSEVQAGNHEVKFHRACGDDHILPHQHSKQKEAMWSLISFISYEAPYNPQIVPLIHDRLGASGVVVQYEPCYSTNSERDIKALARLEDAASGYILQIEATLSEDPTLPVRPIDGAMLAITSQRLMNEIGRGLEDAGAWHGDASALRVRYRKLSRAMSTFKAYLDNEIPGLPNGPNWQPAFLQNLSKQNGPRAILDDAVAAASVAYLMAI